MTQVTHPHVSLDGKPLFFLTNALCEDTGHWTPEEFDALKLPYGEWNMSPYPLTDEEAVLIGDALSKTPIEGTMLFGYSGLYEGKKWLITAIEYYLPDAETTRRIEQEKSELQALVSSHKGQVLYEPDCPSDRLILLLMIPMETALEDFGHHLGWKRFLERGIGATSTM